MQARIHRLIEKAVFRPDTPPKPKVAKAVVKPAETRGKPHRRSDR